MAITVTTEFATPYSTTPLTSTYWRWVGLGIDVTTATANLTVYGYVDEAAYNAGKGNIGQKQYAVNGADFATVATALESGTQALSDIIYDWLEAKEPEFFGAGA